MAIGEVPQPSPLADSDINNMQGTELDTVHTERIEFENGVYAIQENDPAFQEKLNMD